jgi:hypothetical protein
MVNEKTTEPTNPFDVDRLRTTGLSDITVERGFLHIAVRRPGRQEFFRAHKDPVYSLDVLIFEHDDGRERETYWVTEDLRGELIGDLKPVRLYCCVNKYDTPFLWPAKLPDPNSSVGRSWADSALEIAEMAKDSWMRMIGQRDANAYVYFRARGDIGEPAWPDLDFGGRGGWLDKAFSGDRLIDRPDHPALRALKGET